MQCAEFLFKDTPRASEFSDRLNTLLVEFFSQEKTESIKKWATFRPHTSLYSPEIKSVAVPTAKCSVYLVEASHVVTTWPH